MIKLSAFRWVPPFAQGLVRDFRVRWALEEAGIPYQERLIGPDDLATAAYRTLQPFGQVPAIETDELNLFESGAIVLHIAESSETLMPRDANGRARAIAWMFAALNSVEPPIQELGRLDLFHAAPRSVPDTPSALVARTRCRYGAGMRSTVVISRSPAVKAAYGARGLARRPRLSRRPVLEHQGDFDSAGHLSERRRHRSCVEARTPRTARFVTTDPAFFGEMTNLPPGLRAKDNEAGSRLSLEQLARRFE
jgi:hypothetical protein